MAESYRVFIDATALSAEGIRALADRVAAEPEVAFSSDQLVQQLTRSALDLGPLSDRTRTEALSATASGLGAKSEVRTESAAIADSATMIGLGPGDHRPPDHAGEPPSQQEARVAQSARGGLDIDDLDADSLVLLDGSDGSEAPTPIAPVEATKPTEPEPPSDDPRFRPPEEAGMAGGGEGQGELELDLRGQSPAPSAAATPRELDGTPIPPDEEPDEEPDEQPLPEHEALDEQVAPRTAPRSTRTHSARRRRMTVALVAQLRERARLRVALGFSLALGVGAILPMCHARSVMSTSVQELRKELSTAKAHGPVATPAFDSIDQIETAISTVKRRHGFYSLLMWLAGTGGLLFLWFRFM
jgi:hypothetical protein